MTKAESETGGVKIKVPDVETDEICELCGSRLVKKKGRFGYFLACPKFPECTFTKPLVIEMPGKCPKCGGKLLKRNSRNGNAYYACEDNKALCGFRSAEKPEAELCPKCGGKIVESTDERDGSVFWACENNLIRKCGFITWDVPTKEFCPACGKTMFKRSGKGQSKTFCENEECIKFVPLELRGYKKKTAEAEPSAEKEDAPKKKTASSAKKAASSAKKTAYAAKKTVSAGKRTSSAKKTEAPVKASSAAAKKTGRGKTSSGIEKKENN